MDLIIKQNENRGERKENSCERNKVSTFTIFRQKNRTGSMQSKDNTTEH